jgi:hypothetical protein
LTYNFDPDEWHDRERETLEARFRAGELTREEMDAALEKVEERYQEMWDRLDGSYQLPE